MTNTTPERDRGAALLSILMIVAVMSVAALAAVESLGRSLSLARVSSQRSQTMWAARSTEALGAFAVQRIKGLGDDELRLALEARQATTVPFERGIIQAEMSDGSNCFNLNAVTGNADDPHIGQFPALLEALGIFQSDAHTLADSLADWIDTDSDSRAFGAEDSYYGTLDPQYRAANTLLANVSELRAIKGFTPEIIELLRPVVCVRPSDTQSILNLETLTDTDAPLLVALYSNELTVEQAQSVIRQRPLSGWQSLETFVETSTIQAIAESARDNTALSLRPTFLQLNAHITSGSTQETVRLVYEIDKDGKTSLIQRTSGDAL